MTGVDFNDGKDVTNHRKNRCDNHCKNHRNLRRRPVRSPVIAGAATAVSIHECQASAIAALDPRLAARQDSMSPQGAYVETMPSRSALRRLLRHAGLTAAAPPLRAETDLFCHG